MRRHVIELSSHLMTMKNNGLPVDQGRLDEMDVALSAQEAERIAALDALVPIAAKSVVKKDGYKRIPAEVEVIIAEGHDPAAMGWRLIRVPEVVDGSYVEFERWTRVAAFNPRSGDQVKAYCTLKGYKLPKNYKTQKDTTSEDALDELIAKHDDPVLKGIINVRAISKVRGFIKQWQPGRDGLIHPTPVFSGKMFRISWKRPATAATISDKKKRDDLEVAEGFRRAVRAPAGHVIWECDWKGIEAVIVGWLAGDAAYMRLARIGIHDYMCSHYVHDHIDASHQPADLAWDNRTLAAYFKDVKRRWPYERDLLKHVVHGGNYGMTWPLLKEYLGITAAMAKRMIAFYFDLFPKIRIWQDATLQRAHYETVLTNPYGYRMPFWEVYRYDHQKFLRMRAKGVTEADARRQAYVLGKEAKAAIAFLPRDTANGMLRIPCWRCRG